MFLELKENKGFTLIELLIVIVLLGLISTAIFEVYLGQKKAHEVNEEVAAIQQNIRASLYYMEDDLKKAGLDPSENAGAGIVVADVSTIQFTLDITGGQGDGLDNDKDDTIDETDEWYDGSTNDAGENITYSLYDSGGDGDMDLGRLVGAGVNAPVADNIDVLNIVYLDGNGAVVSPPPLTAALIANVRSVEITLVARSERAFPDYTDTQAYSNRQGDVILPAPNDHFRRFSMTTTVKLRNIGL